ncbi:uncharacterized protein VP01_2974g2 [Puccinia sorghi]|uniref:DUF8040 domain-containing protein n=1 Tax=Puccinia sorghi TaxID=27349 RepID=A0A0L6V0P4_9BASI|nr:uncharacterized protein VP01_2974g2 [Puccinia sorghi]
MFGEVWGSILVICIYIVGQGATNNQMQDRFQHIGETISHIIHLVCCLVPRYIVEPPINKTHPTISGNPKYSPLFNKCLEKSERVSLTDCLWGILFLSSICSHSSKTSSKSYPQSLIASSHSAARLVSSKTSRSISLFNIGTQR